MIVYTTTKNEKEATKIAKALIENKLVACVNIVPKIKSVFRWKGKINEESEALLLAKTSKRKFKMIEKKIKELHSYKLPAIITIKFNGNKEFLKWVE